MTISDIQPTRAVSFAETCCQCALPGSVVEPLAKMRASVNGETVKFYIHLACLTKLAGSVADVHWHLITEHRARALRRSI